MSVAIDLLPTPVGTPPPQGSRPTISAEINTATRKQHTELNRLIIDRLPLALPPHTSSPERYATGISAFAPTYAAFEAAFTDLSTLKEHADTRSSHELELLQWLIHLRPRGLARTQYLQRDEGISPRQKLGTFHYNGHERRIHTLCTRKPHVLVAYTWVMYMAIFSGGRWIRQQLANAGQDFWAGSSSGFDFLSFPDSSEDGEDIKREYKARLAAGEHLLTEHERQDILDAAVDLFEMCIHRVYDLDLEFAVQEKRLQTISRRDRIVLRAVSLVIVSIIVLCLWKIAMPKLQILSS